MPLSRQLRVVVARFALAVCASMALPCGAALGGPPPGFDNELLLSGLNVPLSLGFLPDRRVLVLLKEGKILIFDPDDRPVVADLYMTITDIQTNGERGLLDITLDPDFANNNFFYLYYAPASTSKFRIARFEHQGDTGELSSETVIWEDNELSSCCHFGGAIDFGPDGKLYLTTGDEGDGLQAQDLTRSGGKVICVNADGSVPVDNPFFDGEGPNVDSTWARGLRNPFRARWDVPTGRLFIGEVGGNDQITAWEDVHLGEPGANYGWPFCEGPCDNPDFPKCDCKEHTEAIFAYPHLGISASVMGGPVYRGASFPPYYVGVYFFGDFIRHWVRFLTFDPTGEVVTGDFSFDSNAGEMIFIDEGPVDGALYYTTLTGGEVRRYVYAPSGVPGDLNNDGAVDIQDLFLLLGAWGPCDPPPAPCYYDIDGDGIVGILDLLLLLGNWTPEWSGR